MNQLGTIRHSDKSDGELASGAMEDRGHLKRGSAARRRLHKNSGQSTDFKDKLLCELELQQTVSAKQIRALENTRRELEESRNSFAAFYHQSPIAYITFN